jgi:hypothetical protein
MKGNTWPTPQEQSKRKQLVSLEWQNKPASVLFAIGIERTQLEQIVAQAKDACPSYLFGEIVCVCPQTYGEVAHLAHRKVQPGQTPCLLIALNIPGPTDLPVDLALFLYEYSGQRPVCLYTGIGLYGTRFITVKYPAPDETNRAEALKTDQFVNKPGGHFSDLDQNLLTFRLVYNMRGAIGPWQDDRADAHHLDVLIETIQNNIAVNNFCWVHLSYDGENELGRGQYYGSEKPSVLLDCIVELDTAKGLCDAINKRYAALQGQKM